MRAVQVRAHGDPADVLGVVRRFGSNPFDRDTVHQLHAGALSEHAHRRSVGRTIIEVWS